MRFLFEGPKKGKGLWACRERRPNGMRGGGGCFGKEFTIAVFAVLRKENFISIIKTE